jgi:hypothetical protein
MRRFIAAFATLLFFTGSPSALHGQPSATPGVAVSLYPAWDDEGYTYVEDYFRNSNLLGAIAWETSTRWHLPHDIRLVGAQCGGLRSSRQMPRRDADVQEQIVFVCYEQADSIFRLSSRLAGTREQKMRAASFVLSWMIFDQLSYALVSGLGEPDAPEQFATAAQRPLNRIADHLAMIAMDEARAGGPLDRFVRDVKSSSPQARALLYRALLTMGDGDAEGRAMAGAQEAALLCWMRASVAGSPVARNCAQELEVARVARSAFAAEHQVPAGSRPAAAYDFHPALALPSTPAVYRREAPPLPDTEGSWRVGMEMGQRSRDCRMGGYLTFLPSSGGRPRGTFEGVRYCDTFPGERRGLFMPDTVSIIRTSRALHFTSGGCLYSGGVRYSDTDVRGALRCGDAAGEGGTAVVRGTWSSSPGERVTAQQRQEWAEEQRRQDARRHVQTSPQHAAARTRFQGYDVARDGNLRNAELMRCDCHAADLDGDGDVTLEEYVQPRGSVTRTYRLVQIAGRPLPYPAPDGSGEVLSARLTLHSTGVVVYRLTGREAGGPDTTAVFSGRYEIEDDLLHLRIPPFSRSTGRITGTDVRLRLGTDEWMLWRRVSGSSNTAPPRRNR